MWQSEQGIVLPVNQESVVAQEVCSEDGLVYISDDERPLEVFVPELEWNATGAISFNFCPIGWHQWGRMSGGSGCTVVSRRRQDVGDFCTSVDEERASRSPILDIQQS